MSDASRRIRPGNSGTPGQTQLVAYADTSTVATQLTGRTHTANEGTTEKWIDVRAVGGACHVVFGTAGLSGATNTDFPLFPEDGWVSMQLLNHDTHVRVKADEVAGEGSLYIWFSGDV